MRAWQARKIAPATRCLWWEACSNLDHALADYVGMMPWPRFRRILDAAILDADPDLAEQRAERARTAQDVWCVDSADGLKTIVAKAAAGDAVWFIATVNRIADILASRGDTDPVGARRAKAVGILPRPAEALQLLLEQQHDDDPVDQHVDEHPADQRAAEQQPVDLDPPREPVQVDDHVSLSTRVPAGFAAAAVRPRVVLHFHLTADALKHGHGIVRPEHGEPVTPGQTRLGNLGPMARSSHPAVTHGGWHKPSPNPATSCTAHPADTSTS